MRTNRDKNASKTRKKRGQRVTELVDKALESFEKRLEKDELKLTTAEYLKLLQMGQELEKDTPKDIEVTWVEPETSEEK